MSLNDWFAIDRHATPSMVGVPKAQRRQVESHYEGGIVAFAQNRGRRRPLQDFLFYHHELRPTCTPATACTRTAASPSPT